MGHLMMRCSTEIGVSHLVHIFFWDRSMSRACVMFVWPILSLVIIVWSYLISKSGVFSYVNSLIFWSLEVGSRNHNSFHLFRRALDIAFSCSWFKIWISLMVSWFCLGWRFLLLCRPFHFGIFLSEKVSRYVRFLCLVIVVFVVRFLIGYSVWFGWCTARLVVNRGSISSRSGWLLGCPLFP